MGVEELRDLIGARARREAASRVREAYADAARLRDEAERAEARRLADALGEEEATRRRTLRRELAEARARGRREVLEAQGALLARVFREAEAGLEACVAGSAYREGLAARLEQALSHLDGPVVVEAGGALLPALRAALEEVEPGDCEVELREDDAVPPGFRVRRADDRVVVDATLTAQLAARRPRLESEALRLLTAEAEA